MRIHDIMTSGVRTIGPEAAAPEALALMSDEHFHHLVVVSGREVVGVLSQRDLKGVGAEWKSKTVGELMSAPCVTVSPELQVRQAANLLRGRALGCLPVVEGRKLVGIVTLSDLLELIGRGVNPGGGGRVDRMPHKKVTRRPRAVSA